MVDLRQYINSVLEEFTPYDISDDEQKVIHRNLESYVVSKIIRKKFRKQKITDKTLAEIQGKVGLSVKQNKPIHFVILFGGYKHFWNPSAPEVDWAEVFNLKFLYDWISPVVACYEPGVVVEFVSEDWIIEKMNGYESKDLDFYCKSFLALIDDFNERLPGNFRMKFTRLGDRFDKINMLNVVDGKLSEGYERWGLLNDEEKQTELKRSNRSVILKPGQGPERIIESRIVELAYYDVEALPEFSGDYFSSDEYIYLCFSFGLSGDNVEDWLTLGSTYASTVDFWVGRGILEENNGDFVNRIVSKEQYAKIKEKLLEEEVDTGTFSAPNLKKIEIILGEDWDRLIRT